MFQAKRQNQSNRSQINEQDYDKYHSEFQAAQAPAGGKAIRNASCFFDIKPNAREEDVRFRDKGEMAF